MTLSNNSEEIGLNWENDATSHQKGPNWIHTVAQCSLLTPSDIRGFQGNQKGT